MSDVLLNGWIPLSQVKQLIEWVHTWPGFFRKAAGSLYGRVFCNGVTKTWDVRIHLRGFIPKHGLNTGRVNKQQTGMAGARQREIIQVKSNDANRVQRARLRVNPRKHGQESKHRKTQKARQDYDNYVGSVE